MTIEKRLEIDVNGQYIAFHIRYNAQVAGAIGGPSDSCSVFEVDLKFKELKEVDMSESRKRVFWTEEEKDIVGQRVYEAMEADPSIGHMQAFRMAQFALPEDRRREILAWSVVEVALQPRIQAAQLRAKEQSKDSAQAQEGVHAATDNASAQVPSEPSADRSAAEVRVEGSLIETFSEGSLSASSGQGNALGDSTDVDNTATASRSAVSKVVITDSQKDASPPVGQGATTRVPSATKEEPSTSTSPATSEALETTRGPAFDPLQLEAAWLVTLQSPLVEQALVELMSKAMTRAFSTLSAGDTFEASRHAPKGSPEVRVLVAGFDSSRSGAIEQALEETCEVRIWKPGQPQQVFETLAKICTVAVIAESMPEEVDEFLKSRGVVVLRHEGSPGRLAERIVEAL